MAALSGSMPFDHSIYIRSVRPYVHHTANIFDVIFTDFKCVRLSTVVSLYGLHLIAAPSTAE